MKKAISLVLAILALGALGMSAMACGGNASASENVSGSVYIVGQDTGISVTGVGKLSVAADMAILNIGVQSQGQTATAAQQLAAKAMDDVMAALKANGIAEKDITTTNYSVYADYNYSYGYYEAKIVGYTASNNITIKVRDIKNVGNIVDVVVAAGGNDVRVNNVSFTIDNPAAYDVVARELAMADALVRAQQLADLGGVKLGKPSYITEYGGFSYNQSKVYYDTNEVYAPALGASTPVTPGEIDLTLTIQVVYNIQ